MSDTLHVVRYKGPFGFIKPWTAVRDIDVYSQQFLTPSIVEGLRQKLEVSAILRHRITHAGMDMQQEQTQARGWHAKTLERKPVHRVRFERSRAIVNRGVLLNPCLYLAFPTAEDAERAAEQHLCLCRNEDIMLPEGEPLELTVDEFEQIAGFELLFGEGPDAVLVGYNRFERDADGRPAPMYGRLLVVGDPILTEEEV